MPNATAVPIRGSRNRWGFLRGASVPHDARVAVATVAVTKPAQPRLSAHAVENLPPTAGNPPPSILAISRPRPADYLVAYLAFLAFFARRASRYFLIVAFGRSLCLAQTIPKTGAALLEQPGTGQS